MKVIIASAPLATSWKQVSVETSKALCKPITASCEAKQTLFESSTVSTETNIASRPRANVAREAIKIPREPKTASAKAMWITKSLVSSEAREKSLDKASCEANSALHKAQPTYHARLKPKHLCVL